MAVTNSTPLRTGRECAGSHEALVTFPVLLETLEDIGRLLSMNLDLDTLLPTIASTAKRSLKCAVCDVYLWDSRRQSLVSSDLDESRDTQRFFPCTESGIGAWVIRERMIWTRGSDCDVAMDQAEAAAGSHLPDAVAPLTAGGNLLGLLVVDGMQQLTPNFEQMLSTLANIYGLGIKNALLFRRVEELSRRDGLTGLLNHTTFLRELQSLVRKSAEEGTPLSLVMSDVDHFKCVNDECGHQAGDAVLRKLARLWKAALPDAAVIARYGGEEFIAALPEVDEDQAAGLAEFLRSSIAEHLFRANGHEMRVTASFGVTGFAGPHQSTDELIRAADQCLYAAKNSGRNQVASHAELVTTPLHIGR